MLEYQTSYMLYSSKAYNELIKDTNIVRSMSRAGKPTDNPVNEALNGWIKEELEIDFRITEYRSREEFVDVIANVPVTHWDTTHLRAIAGNTTRGNCRIKIHLPTGYSAKNRNSCKNGGTKRDLKTCLPMKTRSAEKYVICLLLKTEIP